MCMLQHKADEVCNEIMIQANTLFKKKKKKASTVRSDSCQPHVKLHIYQTFVLKSTCTVLGIHFGLFCLLYDTIMTFPMQILHVCLLGTSLKKNPSI